MLRHYTEELCPHPGALQRRTGRVLTQGGHDYAEYRCLACHRHYLRRIRR